MNDTISNVCKKCGAALEYNVTKQKWICEYCKTEYKIDDLKEKEGENTKIDTSELDEYYCSNCGASVISGKDTVSTSCIYCDSPVIIKRRLVEKYRPEYIIPFKNKKEDIMNHFLNNKKILSDRSFFKKENIVEIENLYVPYWLVSCDVLGNITGTAIETTDAGSFYRFARMGKLKLSNVPADAKSNLDNNLLRGIEPFDYNKLVKFEYPYLAGMKAEKYDVGKEEVYKEQIKERIEKTIVTQLIRSGRIYSNPTSEKRDIVVNKLEYKYVLVPVWFLKVKYKNKLYLYCINDQTKKIAGIYQMNGLKEFLLVMIIPLLIFLSLHLILGDSERSVVLAPIYVLVNALVIYLINKHITSYNEIKHIKDSDYIKDGVVEILVCSDTNSYF